MLVRIADVRRYVLSLCRPLNPVRVPTLGAVGSVLAEAVRAGEDVPGFINSSMDGYALRSADVVGAPARLAVVGLLMAGDDPSALTVGPGQAVRIMTGAALPAGADAVCMVERTTAGDGWVVIEEAVPLGHNIRPAGDDVRRGEVVFSPGTVIGAAHIGLLSSLGVEEVGVYPRPRVGVLSTGDELAGPGPLAPAKLRDSNRPALLAQVEMDRFVPVDLGHVADDEDALVAALTGAAARCDAVLTSGGVSVGDRDLVKTVLARLGGDGARSFQVAVKPAKPFAFSTLAPAGVPVFGLPGNPVSALVSYELFARPALRLMSGHGAVSRPVLTAVAGARLGRHPDGKTHLLRVALSLAPDGHLEAAPSGGQGSHQVSALAGADGLALVPDGEGVNPGDEVAVMVLDLEGLGTPPGREPQW